MQSESTILFDDLATQRLELQRFCVPHRKSLLHFREAVCFKLYVGEPNFGTATKHLSSTATCIESLLGCPEELTETTQMAVEFATAALARSDWSSEGSANIYCRCRTLPLVVEHLPQYEDRVRVLLRDILLQLRDSNRLGIGEASGKEKYDWYPPNAFHTYWTLRLLQVFEGRFKAEFEQIKNRFRRTGVDIERIRSELRLWAKQMAGYQMALHTSDSSTLDSDQLAWSLAILLTFEDDSPPNLAQQDFLRQGLKCLFQKQSETGIWRMGAPLFHYKDAGNAHCYVFETFTVLLKAALSTKKDGSFLRRELLPFAENLLRLLRYATATKISPPDDPEIVIWSSGHRANRNVAESWATASVYLFGQYLRRLIGIWTREAATQNLPTYTSRESKEDAVKTLFKRGETWADGEKGAASQLMTLFVNPARLFQSDDALDPDDRPVHEEQARGAILFGPPGTSKTTLSRAVADALGWKYVELHASHFVADGLPNVQSTADGIFERLLQVDRTVILFDEIDELVRAREMEPDAFGRFLTTSMLPKLAELWKRRKVIYFVATNHIRFFDPAITRAERFDALLHVAPPSFEKKLNELLTLLRMSFDDVSIDGITAELITDAVQRAVDEARSHASNVATKDALEINKAKLADEYSLPESCTVAKLLLMRWDQLQELASHLRVLKNGQSTFTLNGQLLKDGLAKLSDSSLRKCRPYREYLDSKDYQQHDFSKIRVWEVKGNIPPSHSNKFRPASGKNWYAPNAALGGLKSFPCNYEVVAPGIVECQN